MPTPSRSNPRTFDLLDVNAVTKSVNTGDIGRLELGAAPRLNVLGYKNAAVVLAQLFFSGSGR